jgi:hypothetical protein
VATRGHVLAARRFLDGERLPSSLQLL